MNRFVMVCCDQNSCSLLLKHRLAAGLILHFACAYHGNFRTLWHDRIILACILCCRTYLFPRFLNPERAEHFVDMAKARLAPSELALKKGDTNDNTRLGLTQKTVCRYHTNLRHIISSPAALSKSVPDTCHIIIVTRHSSWVRHT